MRLLEEELPSSLPKSSGGAYKSRPLSADDIKKAKSAATAAPLSPPSASGKKDAESGKRQREDDEEAFPDTTDEVVKDDNRPPKKKKKKVSWAPEEKLVTVKTVDKYLPTLVRDSDQSHQSAVSAAALTHYRLCW